MEKGLGDPFRVHFSPKGKLLSRGCRTEGRTMATSSLNVTPTLTAECLRNREVVVSSGVTPSPQAWAKTVRARISHAQPPRWSFPSMSSLPEEGSPRHLIQDSAQQYRAERRQGREPSQGGFRGGSQRFLTAAV